MLGKIARSLRYSIINSAPGKTKKAVKKGKKPPKVDYDGRDYRGVDGVVDDASGTKKK